MPLITFRAKRRIYTEEYLELIDRGIREFDDNSSEWNWGIRTCSFRSEDIQSIEAFSKTQCLVWFYDEGGFVLVNEPEKKVREKLNDALEGEDDKIETFSEQIPEESEDTEDDA